MSVPEGRLRCMADIALFHSVLGVRPGVAVAADRLRAAGHDVLAVEMEGAAVAQVCHDYSVPFAAVRTISDRADDSAHADFPSFIDQVASKYAQVIIEKLLKSL